MNDIRRYIIKKNNNKERPYFTTTKKEKYSEQLKLNYHKLLKVWYKI